MEGYKTQIKHLDKNDVINLYLNGMGVKAECSDAFDIHTKLSLNKIVKELPEAQMQEIQGIVSRFVVDHCPWWGEEKESRQTDTIMQAVFQLRKLNITYQKQNQEISQRTIRPYGIVIKDNIWYLVAYCEKANEIRTFRCERIKESELLGESFIYPQGFLLKDYFEQTVTNFKEKCANIDVYYVTFTILETQMRYLGGLEYKILCQQQGKIRVCVNLHSFQEAVNEHWNLMIHASMIEPFEVRETIQSALQE